MRRKANDAGRHLPKTGFDRSYVSNVEGGKSNPPLPRLKNRSSAWGNERRIIEIAYE